MSKKPEGFRPLHPVTACIPTYNRWDVLPHVIPSYLSQDPVGRLLVVDDGSSDGTADKLKSQFGADPRVEIMESRHNQGPNWARNRLVGEVRTPYLFMGEDDIWLQPGLIRRLLVALKHYRADGTCARIANVGSLDAIQQPCPPPVSSRLPNDWDRDEVIADAFYAHPPEPVPAIHLRTVALLRTEMCRKVRYDPGFRRKRDETDFYLRATRRGYRFYYVPDVYTLHIRLQLEGRRKGGVDAGSAWRADLTMIRDHARFLRRHLDYLCEFYGRPRHYHYYLGRFILHQFIRKRLGIPPLARMRSRRFRRKLWGNAVANLRGMLPDTVYRALRYVYRAVGRRGDEPVRTAG